MNNVVLTDGVFVLKPLVAGEASEWLAGEDDEQIRWFEALRSSRLSDVQRFIAECQESWSTMGTYRHWGIRKTGSEILLGGVDVRDLGDDEVNLSYVVFAQFRRDGVARGAALLALRYAERSMGARRAVIKMLPDNLASVNLAKGLGAVYVGDEPSDAGAMFSVFTLFLQSLS
jgi:RimJ/RimL family protein N-acetyltransferase